LTDGGETVFDSVNDQGEIVGDRVNEFGGLVGSFLLKRGVFQTVSANSINNEGHVGGAYVSDYG
jgi:hypothetical protein